MSATASETFGQRVNAVFGGLGGAPYQDESKQWSISRQQVFRAGRDDSSSDEEEAAGDTRTEHDILEYGDNVQIDQQGNVVQPSHAFCRALDNEQEYDEVDAVAGTTLRGTTDPADLKPHRHTAVLDDNAFDRRMRSQAPAGTSHVQAVSEPVDTSMKEVMPRSQRGQIRAPEASHRHRSEGLSRHQQHLLPGKAPHSGQGRTPRRSTVPDHVRNPDKYTCYVLDEPLTVGEGDKGVQSDGGRAELEKAARAASSAAGARQMFLQAEEQPQELPAFGAGIEFRPSKKRRQQTMKQDAPAAGATVQMSGLTEDTDESGQFELDNGSSVRDTASKAPNLFEAKPRRRQYRSKPDLT